MDLDNETSKYVNLQPNYVHQRSFYINHANSESALQYGGWTKIDYQHLQG